MNQEHYIILVEVVLKFLKFRFKIFGSPVLDLSSQFQESKSNASTEISETLDILFGKLSR